MLFLGDMETWTDLGLGYGSFTESKRSKEIDFGREEAGSGSDRSNQPLPSSP